ncbi:MAG: Fe-Mn family superoxide dismutase [Bacteroidia bacterium]
MENENSRRDFLKKSATLVIGAITASSILNQAFAAGNFSESSFTPLDGGKFTLPALPYGYDALEPHIDKMTMEIHHDKHHKAYVDNLNKALETADSSILSPAAAGSTPTFETIFDKVAKLPPAIRNNAGGHYNHSLFWTLMKPSAAAEPTGKLADAIKTTFTSFDEFKKQFTDAAMKRFGSGWAWLVKTADGKLVITSTPNQDNPLMNLDSVEVKGTPVLALDVWEHAYYLKNQNRRADYITSFWNVVNWDTAEGLYTGKK